MDISSYDKSFNSSTDAKWLFSREDDMVKISIRKVKNQLVTWMLMDSGRST